MHVQRNHADFNCKTCQNKHCDERGDIKDSLGAATFDRYTIEGVATSRVCFVPQITALSAEYLHLHTHYKNGVLINKGGLYDQPNSYNEAMRIINNVGS